MTTHYQHIVVSGTPYERGYSHGLQAQNKILTNIKRYKSSPSLGSHELCLKLINESYIPATQELFPDGFEEMKGIACGAGVEIEDIVLLNARYDLARLTGHKVGECTSMSYIGPGGSAIVAQNWDMAAWLHDLNTIIVLESHLTTTDSSSQASSIPAAPKVIISLTEAGQLARSGMNSLGLALCANSLWCNEDQPPTRPCLPFTLARAMYLNCPNFAAGLKTLSTFPRHVSGNIMVGSLDLLMDLELTPSRTFTVHPEVQIFEQTDVDNDSHLLLTHANHYQHQVINSVASSITYDKYPGGSSLFRDRRLSQLLQARLRQRVKQRASARSQTTDEPVSPAVHKKDILPAITPPEEAQNRELPPINGESLFIKPQSESIFPADQVTSLSVSSLKSAFADHASFPRSICEHHDKGVQKYGAASFGGSTMTVASVIYDLRRGEMHVSTGNPCQGESCWKRYSIEMEPEACR